MQCITTITYVVRVNGKPSGHIIPSKRLHQGDPLSPYLFLIYAEGLSALIKKAVANGLLEGISVCRGGPCLSHLFFADDSLIFCKATVEECEALQKVLCAYEQSSGQQLNRTKTSLFFSPNTTKEIQDEIRVRFGAQVIRQHEEYLGLPSLVGRNKKNTFKEVKTKLAKKLAGWKEKLLSKARKEVLIKAVAQAIPTYTMSCFKIPDSLCDEMTSIIRNFWWGQCKEERKMAWISCEKLCTPKACGGMGFKQLKQFNLAMLAKQRWRLQSRNDSLLYKVFKAKYFPGCDFVDASLGKKPSFAWRSILAAQAIVRNGRRWQVGNGHSIMIWKDKWVPSPSTFKVVSPVSSLPEDSRVAALIDEENGVWKNELVRQVFLPHEVELICSIALSANLPADKQVWAPTHNGIFTVRSAYQLAMEVSSAESVGGMSDTSQLRRFWKYLWSCNIPHKIRHFAWRACKEVLPTKENLVRRKVLLDGACDECNLEVESLAHLFWRCQHASEIWRTSNLFQGSLVHQFGSFMDILWFVVMIAKWDRNNVEKLIVIAWALWSNRNKCRNGC